MTFDMNAAWSRAMILTRENFSLLAVIAGIFVLLPTVTIYLMVPGMETFIDPMADPEIVQEKLLDVMGPLISWGLLMMIVQFIGYNAMVTLMGGDRPTVGEALGRGAKAVPTIIAAVIIFILAYMLVAIVISIPITMLAGAIGAPGLAIISSIVVLGVFALMMARFSITMPVVVNEAVLNPVRALKRSWDLTGPSQWRILGFWVILFIAYMIISLLISGVLGVVAAIAGGGMATKLILGLTNGIIALIVGIVQCALAVSIHTQLAGPSEADITSTFE